jgi:hypothetical protein
LKYRQNPRSVPDSLSNYCRSQNELPAFKCRWRDLRGIPLINPVSYAPRLPEVTTPTPKPAQTPVAPVRGDTVNFSAQALATAVVDAQMSGAIEVPQA